MSAAWVDIARRYIGVREIKGPKHAAVILVWLAKLGAWWRDDETPWCGTFVAQVLTEAGVVPVKAWYRAMAWADWGLSLHRPLYGCIVVFSRAGGGHVGIVVGQDASGNLQVLGGNQGDAVSIATFKRDRVVAYRWPAGAPLTDGLPVLASVAVSTSEA